MRTVLNATARLVGSFTACVLFASCPVLADPMPRFTGYTRIGHPPSGTDGDKGAGKEKGAKDASERIIGVTIYYMVLDAKLGDRSKATDTWGVGLTNFDSTFAAGERNDRDELDTEARYLYLYQIVNDRPGSETAIKELSIRLLVEPDQVTSWGTFRPRAKIKGDRNGLGFSMEFPNPKEGEKRWLVLPVSTRFPGVSDRRYLNPAPPIVSPRPYSVMEIRTGKILDADASEIGRPPEGVLLVRNVDFGAADDADPRAGREAGRKRHAAIRALWRNADAQIKPRERSTIFGFTSRRPPTLDTVAVGGRALGIGWASNGRPGLPAAGMLVSAGTGNGLRDRSVSDVESDRSIFSGVEDLRRLAQKNEAGAFPAVSGTLPTPAPASTIAPKGGKLPTTTLADRTATAQRGAEPSLGGLAGPSLGLGTGVTPGTTSASGLASAGTFAGLGNGGGGGGSGSGSGGGGSGSGGGGSGSGQSGNASSGSSSSGGSGSNTSQNASTNSGTSVSTQSSTQSSAQNAAQNAGQNQGQNQLQSQTSTVDVRTMPAPPAWLLALLGLPAFYFLARRLPRKNRVNEGAEGTVT